MCGRLWGWGIANMGGQFSFSTSAVRWSRIYFLLSGIASVAAGGILISAATHFTFWVGIAFLIAGIWFIVFAFLGKRDSVAKAAQESLEDADT